MGLVRLFVSRFGQLRADVSQIAFVFNKPPENPDASLSVSGDVTANERLQYFLEVVNMKLVSFK